MPAIPTTNLITADGDHFQSKARGRGRNVSIEISGTFGGASVTPGYMSADAVPVFVPDGTAKTAIGRWIVLAPNSGKLALRVTSASGTTSILAKFTECVPG